MGAARRCGPVDRDLQDVGRGVGGDRGGGVRVGHAGQGVDGRGAAVVADGRRGRGGAVSARGRLGAVAAVVAKRAARVGAGGGVPVVRVGHRGAAQYRRVDRRHGDRPTLAASPGLHCGAGAGITTIDNISSSPGHQAGAPLRRGAAPGWNGWSSALPPAIRQGLHCGNSESDGMLGQEGLPPAIRPGLHCGTFTFLA